MASVLKDLLNNVVTINGNIVRGPDLAPPPVGLPTPSPTKPMYIGAISAIAAPGVGRLYKWDGTSITQVSTDFSTYGWMSGIAINPAGTEVTLAGRFIPNYTQAAEIFTIGGGHFSRATPTNMGGLTAVKYASDGTLFIGGGHTPPCGLIRWTGSAWDVVGGWIGSSQVANPTVYDLIVNTTSDLIAAGNFTIIGGVSTTGVAHWNGLVWESIGTGVCNGAPMGVTKAPNGHIYVTGQFTSIGGVAANNVAEWDGTAWKALGTGLSNYGGRITHDSAGNIYVTGSFLQAGGVDVNYVAKWDGTSWSALGSGVNSPFSWNSGIVCDAGDNIYVSGVFTTAGGVSAKNIARWDGAAWHALGAGIPISASGMCLSPA